MSGPTSTAPGASFGECGRTSARVPARRPLAGGDGTASSDRQSLLTCHSPVPKQEHTIRHLRDPQQIGSLYSEAAATKQIRCSASAAATWGSKPTPEASSVTATRIGPGETLREADVELAQSRSACTVCRNLSLVSDTHHRRRNEDVGLMLDPNRWSPSCTPAVRASADTLTGSRLPKCQYSVLNLWKFEPWQSRSIPRARARSQE